MPHDNSVKNLPLITALFNTWMTTGSIQSVLIVPQTCNFANIPFQFACTKVSRHHAGNLISVYGLSTWHNSRWKWNLMIRPHSKRMGAVWGKDSDLMQCFKAEAASGAIHKHKLVGNLLCFSPHLPVSSFCNSIHALISSHLSTLSATRFAH